MLVTLAAGVRPVGGRERQRQHCRRSGPVVGAKGTQGRGPPVPTTRMAVGQNQWDPILGFSVHKAHFTTPILVGRCSTHFRTRERKPIISLFFPLHLIVLSFAAGG